MRTMAVLLLFLYTNSALAAERTLGVFVALADNEHQGLVPVPKAIGKGDDPERNLYWGTSEGLKETLDRSSEWKLQEKNDAPAGKTVLRTRIYRNEKHNAKLTAMAYDGAAIQQCIQDFEKAMEEHSYDLVAYIGHNGLMDFQMPLPQQAKKTATPTDCMVLCCMSQRYFQYRIEAAGGRPVLLTTQLMYPGSFILRDAVNCWLTGGTPEAIRLRAGAAYAENQKLSKKAGLGIFANLKN